METLKVALVNYRLALREAKEDAGAPDVRFWAGYIEAWKRHLKLAGAVQSDFDRVEECVRIQLS